MRLAPLLMGTAVLWAYVCSASRYRTWYFAAAIAVVAIAAVATRLDTRGLLRAMLPVLSYFALLLLTARSAAYPRDTVRWVLIDSIEIVVFVLFFLAGRNARAHEIAAAMTTIIIPATVIAISDYVRDPFTPRPGSYALALLPLIFAFSAAGLAISRRRSPYVAAMILAIALLLIGRSRIPLVAGVLVIGLSVIVFGDGIYDRIRRTAIAMLAAAAMVLLAAVIPATRPMLITTVVRFGRELPPNVLEERLAKEIDRTAYWKQVLPREHTSVRVPIAELGQRLGAQAFPFGIGYMNFQRHFEKHHGYLATLHSMYAAWWIEGGLAVALVACAGLLFLVIRLWRSEQTEETKAILLGLGAAMLMGAFHQMHQSPALWLLLGLGASIVTRDASS